MHGPPCYNGFMQLTKYEAGRISLGPVLGTGPVYRYRVAGLPPGEEADLACPDGRTWRILRVKDGVLGKWTGSYTSADEALGALRTELTPETERPL